MLKYTHRWLRADDPADPRYMGEFLETGSKYGEWVKDAGSKVKDSDSIKRCQVTMEEMKEKWGLNRQTKDKPQV